MAGALDVGIVVRDLEAMTRFYAELLGVGDAVDLELPNGARIRKLPVGDSILKLYLPPQAAAGDVPEVLRAPGLRYFTASSPLPLEHARLAAARDGEAAAEIIEVPGVRVVLLTDPEGNTVELIERRDAETTTPSTEPRSDNEENER